MGESGHLLGSLWETRIRISISISSEVAYANFEKKVVASACSSGTSFLLLSRNGGRRPFFRIFMHELDKKIGRRDNAYYMGEYLLHIYKCKNDFYLDLPCTLKKIIKNIPLLAKSLYLYTTFWIMYLVDTLEKILIFTL